jgi:hypothetical protein
MFWNDDEAVFELLVIIRVFAYSNFKARNEELKKY